MHGVNGLFGVLAVGIFADGTYGAGWNGTGPALDDSLGPFQNVTGLLYGNPGQLGAQAIGALVLCTVMFGVAYASFKIRDKLTKGGIRSSEEDELAGLDVAEMGCWPTPSSAAHPTARGPEAGPAPRSGLERIRRRRWRPPDGRRRWPRWLNQRGRPAGPVPARVWVETWPTSPQPPSWRAERQTQRAGRRA